MNFTFDSSLNAKQLQWVKDTINRITFPLDSVGDDVLVTAVSEPSCDGHRDLMCTHDDGSGGWVIEIRDGIEEADHPANAWLPPDTRIQDFFQESVSHEIFHVLSFSYVSDDSSKEAVAAMFTHQQTGDHRTGALDDWNPLDKAWPARVQEAVAETLKDVFFEPRVFDNRTDWLLTGSKDDFLSAVGASVGGGSDIVNTTITGEVDTIDGPMWSNPPAWPVGDLCMDGDYDAYVPSEARELYVATGVYNLHDLFGPGSGDPIVTYHVSRPATPCIGYLGGEPEPKLIAGPDPSYLDVVVHFPHDFTKYLTNPERFPWWQLSVNFEAEVDLTTAWAQTIFNGSNINGYNPGDGQQRVMNNPHARIGGDSYSSYRTPTIRGFMGVAHDAEFTDWAGRDLENVTDTYPDTPWKMGEPYDNVYHFGSAWGKNPTYLRAAPTSGHSIIGIGATYIGGTGVNKEMELDYAADGVHVWYRFVAAPVYLYNTTTEEQEILTYSLSNGVGYLHLTEEVVAPPVPVEWPEETMSAGQGPTGVQRMGGSRAIS